MPAGVGQRTLRHDFTDTAIRLLYFQVSFAVLKFNVREGQRRTVDFDQRIPARRFTADAKKLPGLLPTAQPDMLYYFHQVREISELAVRAA